MMVPPTAARLFNERYPDKHLAHAYVLDGMAKLNEMGSV